MPEAAPIPALPPDLPVYWPRKVTLSGHPALPTPLFPSRAACGLSLVVLLFSENSGGEGSSDSEPEVEKVGHQRGQGVGSHSSRSGYTMSLGSGADVWVLIPNLPLRSNSWHFQNPAPVPSASLDAVCVPCWASSQQSHEVDTVISTW